MYRNRINEEIVEDSVYLYDKKGQLDLVSRAEALERARSEGTDLICEYADPPRRRSTPPVCLLLKRPLQWERLTNNSEPAFDEKLWFETGHCAGRHYLVGNAHTFPGRISAWCPTKKVRFAVSRSEIKACTDEAEYFLRGYLAGQEPHPPVDDEGDALPPDDPNEQAWAAATQLFHDTGSWNARFRTCTTCGARLLPSNPTTSCRNAHVDPR